MPPVVIGAVASTAIFAAGGVVAGTVTFASVALVFAANLALGALSPALPKRP